MNKIDIPSDFIYEFKCDADAVDEFYSLIKSAENIEWTRSKPYPPSTDEVLSWNGYPVPLTDKIVSHFNECVNEVSKLYFQENIELSISDIWVTKTNFGEKSNAHWHRYSVFSGLLYLDDGNAETHFFPKNLFEEKWNDICLVKDIDTCIKIKPEKGKLLIFPSYVHHAISVNRSRVTRHTVAFNTFFNGNVSKGKTRRLEVSTKLNNEK